MNERAEAILREWFGASDVPDEATKKRWFTKDPDFDAHLRETYAEDIEAALRGDYDDWAANPRGALALVVLLDQMTRNVHRGTGDMYRGDDKALQITEAALEAGFDGPLSPDQRQVLYMPLMHAEDIGCQRRCVELFEKLAAESHVDAVSWAVQHRDIVERFGRYPHRNALLGRPSTAEEEAFLEEPGSSF